MNRYAVIVQLIRFLIIFLWYYDPQWSQTLARNFKYYKWIFKSELMIVSTKFWLLNIEIFLDHSNKLSFKRPGCILIGILFPKKKLWAHLQSPCSYGPGFVPSWQQKKILSFQSNANWKWNTGVFAWINYNVIATNVVFQISDF